MAQSSRSRTRSNALKLASPRRPHVRVTANIGNIRVLGCTVVFSKGRTGY